MSLFGILNHVFLAGAWFYTGCVWASGFERGYAILAVMCLACRLAINLGVKDE